jgi:hypothetical protein
MQPGNKIQERKVETALQLFKFAQRCYARLVTGGASLNQTASYSMTLRSLVLFAALLVAPPAFAQNVASFIVDNDDGYGVDACLESGSSCGQVIANAWCEANGYAQAVEFRKQTAADITGSIDKPTEVAATPPHAVIITCEK